MLFGAILLEGLEPDELRQPARDRRRCRRRHDGRDGALPIRDFLHGAGEQLKLALFYKATSPVMLIDQLSEIADTMRRHGPIALERVRVEDPFLKRGVHDRRRVLCRGT